MATNAQIQSFVSTWTSAAEAASQQLGVPASYILAQWGMESGWGTQPNMGENNPGNVGNLGGSWQNYSSQASFVNAYVAAVKSDFPTFSNSSKVSSIMNPVNSPHGTTPFYAIQQLFNGSNSYDPGDTSYGDKVSGAYQAMLTATGQTTTSIDNTLAGKATPLVGIKDPSTGTSESVGDEIQSAESNFTSFLGKAGVVLGAIVFAVVGIFILVKDEIPTPQKLVKEAVK